MRLSAKGTPKESRARRMAPTADPNAPFIQVVTRLVSWLSPTVASLCNKCPAGPLQRSLLATVQRCSPSVLWSWHKLQDIFESIFGEGSALPAVRIIASNLMLDD